MNTGQAKYVASHWNEEGLPPTFTAEDARFMLRLNESGELTLDGQLKRDLEETVLRAFGKTEREQKIEDIDDLMRMLKVNIETVRQHNPIMANKLHTELPDLIWASDYDDVNFTRMNATAGAYLELVSYKENEELHSALLRIEHATQG